MASGTIGDVVEGLRLHARIFLERGSMAETLLLDAARLLEAAGRECRAWRKRNAITDPRDYERALSDVVPFIAALDALAPEMSAALTPPTKEAE